MSDDDVTEQVDFDPTDIDSECLPIQECICGHKWDREHILGIHRDNAKPCPQCGRKLYFALSIRIYRVVGDV